jgi:S-DNA-T family DNA segregation ATPase FtsK/SpoIIIE
VLDSSDAFHLPPLPGYGWLKVDTSIYTRFRAGYVSGPAACREVEHDGSDGDPALLRLPAYPGILAANGLTAFGEEQALPDRSVARTELDELIEAVLDVASTPARTVWLPPLPPRLTLDRVGGGVPVASSEGLRLPVPTRAMQVPMGLLDDPAQQRQQPWLLDLDASGGHVALIGGPQSGKTTWLRTLAAGLALSHTPSQVAIYGLDFAGGGLAPLREFPHVGGVAARTDPDRIRRTMAELGTMLTDREELFAERTVDSLEQLRILHGAGQLPELPVAEVVVLIDGAGALRGEFEQLDEPISVLLQRGSSYGIHVVASVLRWNDLKLALQPAFGTRVELRLNDPTDSVIDRKLAATQRADRPGRALLAGGLLAQTALPRADSQPAIEGSTDALLRLARATAASWPGRRAPGIRGSRTGSTPPVCPTRSSSRTPFRSPWGRQR